MTAVDAPRDAAQGRAGPLRRAAILALQLALTGVVVWFILDRVGVSLEELSQVDPGRWRPRWGPFAASCGLLLGGYLLSGAIWGRMVRDMGGPRLGHGRAARVFMVANLARYIPGKLWQIAGLSLLAREEGVPARIAVGAAVLGQGLALVAATLLGVTAFLEGTAALRSVGLVLLGGVVAGGLVALIPSVLPRLTALWFRLARTEPPEAAEAGPAMLLRWGVLYLVNWIVYLVSFWILVKSFELPGAFLEVAPAYAAAYVLGYAAFFAPAGIGVREGFLTAFLAPVTGTATAATLAVVARLWSTAVEVLPAGVFWARRLVGRGVAPGTEGGGEGP